MTNSVAPRWQRIATLVWILASLLPASHCAARSLVVRADGTGDVRTIQAGIDRMQITEGRCSDPIDSLLIAPGYYDETVSLDFTDRTFCAQPWIIGVGGPNLCSVRTINFPKADDLNSSETGQGTTIEGLSVREHVRQGTELRGFKWRECRFEDGFESTIAPYQFLHDAVIADCVFRGRSRLTGAWITVERCRFEGEHTEIATGEANFGAIDCVFEGAQDTALVVMLYNDGSPYFTGCRFSGARCGLEVRPPGHGIGTGLTISRCVFSDISDAAVSMLRTSDACAFYDDEDLRLSLQDCRIAHCGAGVRCLSPCNNRIVLDRDTISCTQRTAVDVGAGYIRMTNCVIQNGLGDGARLMLVNPGSKGLTVTSCVITGNRGTGLVVSTPPSTPDYGAIDLSANTLVANGGAGISVRRAGASIQRNLFAGNEGNGLECIGPASSNGIFRFNDSWRNGGIAYSGLLTGAGPNLQVDPRFCDAVGGDFHVASSSPCAPSGPYGPIGALGVGCEASHVAVDPATAEHLTNGNLSVAVHGHRLLDVTTIDPGSIRLSGAPARSMKTRDADHDGFADLIAQFSSDQIDVPSAGGTAALRASTREGAPLIGELVLSGIGHGRHTLRPLAEIVPTTNSPVLAVTNGRREPLTGAITIRFSLATREPARIELFDVTGRRIADLALKDLEPGPHDVVERDLPLPDGIYLVRLTQGHAAVTGKTVMIR